MVALAAEGLRTIGEDVALLDPLSERVNAGRAPARDIMDAWARDPSPANILPLLAY
jgi:hypothetical protein